MTLISLFQKSWGNSNNKFVILLPKGGIIYFFVEEALDLPNLVISTSIMYDFGSELSK
jgi:hypothetical protein